ncbi:hypothetical protein NQ314_016361 [Rhamnusium bicolor]|uniref:Myb/SANT-like DNA-binding domain-containing protein n=1 Tax=Rhamnusium bicolor TaxID=1586634 RepID=A0AAV8WW36_9CUCU|nr:hypothetical protein NQ314_016361 [Rhamnusium bicolor]
MSDSEVTHDLSPNSNAVKNPDESVCKDANIVNVSESEQFKSVSSQCGHYLNTDEDIVVTVKSYSPVREFESEDEQEAMDDTEVGSQIKLAEFFILETGTQSSKNISSDSNIAKWNINNTKILIDMYNTYRNKVGSYQIKTIKQMWQVIANELNAATGMNFGPTQCENKWRVLGRT